MDAGTGWESEPLPVRWNARDLLLYAVGVGAKATELSTVYEDDKSYSPLPVYPLVLGEYKGPSHLMADSVRP